MQLGCLSMTTSNIFATSSSDVLESTKGHNSRNNIGWTWLGWDYHCWSMHACVAAAALSSVVHDPCCAFVLWQKLAASPPSFLCQIVCLLLLNQLVVAWNCLHACLHALSLLWLSAAFYAYIIYLLCVASSWCIGGDCGVPLATTRGPDEALMHVWWQPGYSFCVAACNRYDDQSVFVQVHVAKAGRAVCVKRICLHLHLRSTCRCPCGHMFRCFYLLYLCYKGSVLRAMHALSARGL